MRLVNQKILTIWLWEVGVGLIKDQKISTNISQVLKSQKNFFQFLIHNHFKIKLIKNLKLSLRIIHGKVYSNPKHSIKKNIPWKEK